MKTNFLSKQTQQVSGVTAKAARATPLAAMLFATALALPFGAVALLIEMWP